jgi:hypothetical protein
MMVVSDGRMLLRQIGLVVALAAYALFSAPAPGRIGVAELVIAAGLVAAVGVRRPIWLVTGYLIAARGTRLYEAVGVAAFLYLLWIPLVRGVGLGWSPADMVRDVVPLIYLFLPVLLGPALLPSGRRNCRLLAWTLAGVGFLLAFRWWWPGLQFRSIGQQVMDEGDLYLLNSPAVLFAAVWLTVGGVDRIVGRFGWRSHLTAGLLLAGGAVAGSALAAVVHRAALGLALTAFAWVGLWWFRQRPS